MATTQQQQVKQIGEWIVFTALDCTGGRTLNGEITGRDWCFDKLAYYTVTMLSGKRFHVNADTLQAGHSF